MSQVRTGNRPGEWRDEGPSSARVTVRHFAVTAEIIGNMRPVIRGYVMSQTRNVATDDAHAKADARLRQKYSIRPENRT